MTTPEEEIRSKRREEYGRIAFDCYNLKARGDRAYCCEGISLDFKSQDGSISLYSALHGASPHICRTCKKYDDGTQTKSARISQKLLDEVGVIPGKEWLKKKRRKK